MDTLETIVEDWLLDPGVGKLVFTLLGIAAIFALTNVSRRYVTRSVSSSSGRYQARKLVSFFGFFAAAVLIVVVFSDALGGLTVAFGVAGAGIAFALQEVIASAAGWATLVLGKFYRVGDRVQLGGIKGDVIDIGILRTTLMQIGDWVDADQYNGRIVRIANSFVFKQPVFNYSGDFAFLWDEIKVPIKYGSDHVLARSIIEKVAEQVVGDFSRQAHEAWVPMTRKYMIEPARVEPTVSMSFNENWIEFVLRYVTDYKQRRTTKDRLYAAILRDIDQSSNQVGIAAATLNIEKHAPIQVTLVAGETARASSTKE